MPAGEASAFGALRVLCAVALALLATGASASASRAIKPGRTHFADRTNIGKVVVALEVTRNHWRPRLTGMRISVNGQRLAWPEELVLDVPHPRLVDMQLVSTASYNCFFDACPDPAEIPVGLIIPFGGVVADPDSAGCERSFLSVSFLEQGITEVTIFECGAGGTDAQELFNAAKAGG
jgi:hypothetical protein